MRITESTSLLDLAATVSRALERRGIDAVLTGGAAVVIWTQGAQQSFDLDFVSTGRTQEIRAVMSELGFTNRGKDYIHPNSMFFVEFPTGPLAVGSILATPNDVVLKRTRRGTLRIISPTFSVMDRLAQFFFWNDRSALDQAIAISAIHDIDLKKIEKWAKAEGMSGKFHIFREQLGRDNG